MARRVTTRKRHPLKRARAAVSRTAKKVTKRLRPARKPTEAVAAAPRPVAKASRRLRIETDIPIDVLNKTYTPKQTSLKSSFRTNGEDRQRDQEFASGYVETRWNDEDRYTNRSGDPRIGTHHRKYEPGE